MWIAPSGVSPHWRSTIIPPISVHCNFRIRRISRVSTPTGACPLRAKRWRGPAVLDTQPAVQPANGAFLGTDLSTIQAWGGNGQSVKFEAEVKRPTTPGGAVTRSPSPMPSRRSRAATRSTSELRIQPLDDPLVLNTNVYVNSDGGGLGPGVKTTTVNFQDWNEFTLIWTPNQSVEWLINGHSFLKETRKSGGVLSELNSGHRDPLAHRPDVIGQAGRHRRRPLADPAVLVPIAPTSAQASRSYSCTS